MGSVFNYYVINMFKIFHDYREYMDDISTQNYKEILLIRQI